MATLDSLIIIIPCREASTKEELCTTPRKKFVKMSEAPDPELTSIMQKPCMKSRHPSVHICKKRPETDFARKVHKKMRSLLKRLEKRESRRKKKKMVRFWRKKKKTNRNRRKQKSTNNNRRKKKGKNYKRMRKSRKWTRNGF